MTEKPATSDEPKLCSTCGKPMDDLIAMAKCLDKWVPPNWNKMLNSSWRRR